MVRFVAAALGAGIVASGCAGAGGEGGEPVGEAAEAVTAEIAGKVEYAFRYYNNPERARVAFASPTWMGCSATMLGPNVVLTAAHCGPSEAAADQTSELTFTTYRADETARNSEQFECARLAHGWPNHDLALLYCKPNAAGVSPGDKYGYLDYETRAPALNDPVYSIWWNPVTSGATGGTPVPLYSAGKVTSTSKVIWSPPLLDGPANDPIGITVDTWAKPGASGSASIDANTHRILVGPTSTVSADLPEGAPGKHALSMQTYLNQAELLPPTSTPATGFFTNVQPGNFPPEYGFDFTYYPGRVDKTANGVFDVQEDVERRRGENARPFYWFGFGSRRRNLLWNISSGATPNLATGELAINASSPRKLLEHTRLALKPNTTYRVALFVRTDAAGTPNALSLALEQGTTSVAVRTLATAPGSGKVLRVAELTTNAAPSNLVVRVLSSFTGAISDLALSEDGSTMTFELADEREAWRTSSGGRAGFLPRGLTAEAPGAKPDFALAVNAGSLFGFVFPIPVTTHHAGLLPSRGQRLCFNARRKAGAEASDGVVRVKSGTGDVIAATFPLTAAWASWCSSTFVTPDQRSSITFETNSAGVEYLVDNLGVYLDPTWFPPILN